MKYPLKWNRYKEETTGKKAKKPTFDLKGAGTNNLSTLSS